jgi:hypothetical protein
VCYNEIAETALSVLNIYFNKTINSIPDVVNKAVEFNVALDRDLAWIY